jgi:hypothetical protein
MAENVKWGQIINSTYSWYLIFEIAAKPGLEIANNLVASFEANLAA